MVIAIRQLSERRRDLVLTHLELVHVVARAVRRDLPQPIDSGELEDHGFEGLLVAAARFQFGRRVSFATFAGYRIRGAMLDALRRRVLARWLAPLDEVANRVSDDSDAEQTAIDREAHARLHRAMATLPREARDVIRQVYFEGKLLVDVAAVLGVSKWSATRLHTLAVKQLRDVLEDLPRGKACPRRRDGVRAT